MCISTGDSPASCVFSKVYFSKCAQHLLSFCLQSLQVFFVWTTNAGSGFQDMLCPTFGFLIKKRLANFFWFGHPSHIHHTPQLGICLSPALCGKWTLRTLWTLWTHWTHWTVSVSHPIWWDWLCLRKLLFPTFLLFYVIWCSLPAGEHSWRQSRKVYLQ